MKATIAMAMALLSSSALARAAADAPGPGEVVESAAQAMLKDLDANRDAYRKDPSKVDALVEKNLLPHFDIQYSARLVLGRHWRDATPEQRQKFIDAFYHSLLHNYGNALVDFTGDRLKVFPVQLDSNADRVTVRTEVKRRNGTKVPVNYSLHKTDAGWQAWDVVIEGISYVKSFREDFGAEIDAKGIDSVIERIRSGGKPVQKTS